MLAEKDTGLKKAVTKVYQLSEEEKFRQQCQAREDFQRQLMDRDKYYNDIIAEQKEALLAQAEKMAAQEAELDDAKSELARYKQALIDAGIDIGEQTQ